MSTLSPSPAAEFFLDWMGRMGQKAPITKEKLIKAGASGEFRLRAFFDTYRHTLSRAQATCTDTTIWRRDNDETWELLNARDCDILKYNDRNLRLSASENPCTGICHSTAIAMGQSVHVKVCRENPTPGVWRLTSLYLPRDKRDEIRELDALFDSAVVELYAAANADIHPRAQWLLARLNVVYSARRGGRRFLAKQGISLPHSSGLDEREKSAWSALW
jgi:hypothetical protein